MHLTRSPIAPMLSPDIRYTTYLRRLRACIVGRMPLAIGAGNHPFSPILPFMFSSLSFLGVDSASWVGVRSLVTATVTNRGLADGARDKVPSVIPCRWLVWNELRWGNLWANILPPRSHLPSLDPALEAILWNDQAMSWPASHLKSTKSARLRYTHHPNRCVYGTQEFLLIVNKQA